jgi:hypothetical protein
MILKIISIIIIDTSLKKEKFVLALISLNQETQVVVTNHAKKKKKTKQRL